MSELVSLAEADRLNLHINSLPPQEILAGISFMPDPLDRTRYLIEDGKTVESVSEDELLEIGRRRRFAQVYGGIYATRAAEVAQAMELEAATRGGDWFAA